MHALNIIGAGKLGRTLGHLWQHENIFHIAGICNRSIESAQTAREFIGAGEVCRSLNDLPDADCWLIASGDSEIASIAAQLAPRFQPLRAQPAIVFHCSGALGSDLLAPCRPAAVASAHPVHSFAHPARSLDTFAGTTVALEGDDQALAILRNAFARLGCELITLDAQHKSLYHAGSVFACNYFTALLDLALQSFAAAGIQRDAALKMLRPIVLQTADNNLALGPEKSLTGPIARGDGDTVAKQLRALQQADPQLAQSYRQLGLTCAALAERGGLPADAVQQLQKILSEPNAEGLSNDA